MDEASYSYHNAAIAFGSRELQSISIFGLTVEKSFTHSYLHAASAPLSHTYPPPIITKIIILKTLSIVFLPLLACTAFTATCFHSGASIVLDPSLQNLADDLNAVISNLCSGAGSCKNYGGNSNYSGNICEADSGNAHGAYRAHSVEAANGKCYVSSDRFPSWVATRISFGAFGGDLGLLAHN